MMNSRQRRRQRRRIHADKRLLSAYRTRSVALAVMIVLVINLVVGLILHLDGVALSLSILALGMGVTSWVWSFVQMRTLLSEARTDQQQLLREEIADAFDVPDEDLEPPPGPTRDDVKRSYVENVVRPTFQYVAEETQRLARPGGQADAEQTQQFNAVVVPGYNEMIGNITSAVPDAHADDENPEHD
jgi:membrane protein required for beta-lactamase induction